MIRNDKSKFLLYMEPRKAATAPINDGLTEFMKKAFKDAKEGVANYSSIGQPEVFRTGSGYKGVHHCLCGESSSNQDYQLLNGMIVNSLCVHYIQCHRDEICANDRAKINDLVNWYHKNGNNTRATEGKSRK